MQIQSVQKNADLISQSVFALENSAERPRTPSHERNTTSKLPTRQNTTCTELRLPETKRQKILFRAHLFLLLSTHSRTQRHPLHLHVVQTRYHSPNLGESHW